MAGAVARKCGAEPSERRRITKDIQDLVAVGYLRVETDCIVVVEQEARSMLAQSRQRRTNLEVSS